MSDVTVIAPTVADRAGRVRAMAGDAIPGSRVVVDTGSGGVWAAFNRALARVDSPFALLIHDDTQLAPQDYRHLLDALSIDGCIAGGGVFCGGHYHLWQQLVAENMSPITLENDGPLDTVRPATAVGFYLAMVRVAPFRDLLHGFDEGFVDHFADTDVCLRAWCLGLPVRFCGFTRSKHAGGGDRPSARASDLARFHVRWMDHLPTIPDALITREQCLAQLVPI